MNNFNIENVFSTSIEKEVYSFKILDNYFFLNDAFLLVDEEFNLIEKIKIDESNDFIILDDNIIFINKEKRNISLHKKEDLLKSLKSY